MKATYSQRKKYGNLPEAKRGVVREFTKMLKSKEERHTEYSEMDVEVRAFNENSYVVQSILNGSSPQRIGKGTYRDFDAARSTMRNYIEEQKRKGWIVMNERKDFAV